MKTCPVCHGIIDARWIKTTGWNGSEDELHFICQNCGFEVVKCPQCGNQIEVRAKKGELEEDLRLW